MMCFSYTILIQREGSSTLLQLPSALATTTIRCTQLDGTSTGVLPSTSNRVSLSKISFNSFSQCFRIGENVDIALGIASRSI